MTIIAQLTPTPGSGARLTRSPLEFERSETELPPLLSALLAPPVISVLVPPATPDNTSPVPACNGC